MPRYDRNDYSVCDWKVTKSDILRKKITPKKRAINLANVLGILLVLVVIVVTVDGIVNLYS